MRTTPSKDWYKRKADLEKNLPIAAGKFPSEILSSKPNLTYKTKAAFASKTAAHKVRRAK